MNSPDWFSALLCFSRNLTQEDVDSVHQILISEGFRGYDFGTRLIVDFEEVLEKYPDNFLYNLSYAEKSFVLSCVKGDDFMTYLIDANDPKSEIILKVTNDILNDIAGTSFSYIDDKGSIPKNFGKSAKQSEIAWLFKYNYFGKDFIEKYGREFFTNMPCVKQEFITEDIIRIDLCKDIFSPIEKSLMKEVSEYLNSLL